MDMDKVETREDTHFDQSKLNSITEISNTIRHDPSGYSVRGAMAQQGEALVKLMQEEGGNQSAEVTEARGGFGTLGMRESAQDNAIYTAQSDAVAGVQQSTEAINLARNLSSGGPAGVFDTVNDLKNAFPSGDSRVYLVLADGKVYYYSYTKGWTAAVVYQATGLPDNGITSSKLAYNVQYGEIVCAGISISPEKMQVIITNCYRVTSSILSFNVNKSITVALTPTTATGFFIAFNTTNSTFRSTTNISSITNDEVYLGWLSVTPSGVTHNLRGNNVTVDNAPDLTTNFVVASQKPAIVNVANKTIDFSKTGGYCRVFYTDQQWVDLKAKNPSPVDISANGANSSFIFVNKDSGVVTANSGINNRGNRTLLGYITWGDFMEHDLGSLRVEFVDYPTKVSVGGMSYVAIGDSITASYNSVKWASIVAGALNLPSMQNLGIKGATYSVRDGHEDSAVDKINDVKGDLITISYGVNDFHAGLPLGTFGSSNTKELYGALDYVYSTVIANNPNSRILVITPMKQHGYNEAPDSYTKNSQGLLQADYVQAIKEVAGKYALPVIDMYNNSGMSPFSEAQATQYFRDGLHPNQAGEYVYARKIVEAIKSLS